MKPEKYTKGLNPTTSEFTNYINGSSDWTNIGKEIKYFKDLLTSPSEYERVDAKGYVLTCMFKILGAICEYEKGKREMDPRENIDQEIATFLGGDLSLEALTQKTLQYGQEIIDQHGQEKTAPALSSVASVYGVRAYMEHLGLATEEQLTPTEEPQKYYQDIAQNNINKNISLAIEKFEESAELGNVRSMGSIVTWVEKCNHPKLQELNQEWTEKAATAETPNPNAQIDYAKMLEEKGEISKAKLMLENAESFGLDKAKTKHREFLERNKPSPSHNPEPSAKQLKTEAELQHD